MSLISSGVLISPKRSIFELRELAFSSIADKNALSNPVAYNLNQSREDTATTNERRSHYRRKSKIRMRVASWRLMNPSAWRVPSAQSC